MTLRNYAFLSSCPRLCWVLLVFEKLTLTSTAICDSIPIHLSRSLLLSCPLLLYPAAQNVTLPQVQIQRQQWWWRIYWLRNALVKVTCCRYGLLEFQQHVNHTKPRVIHTRALHMTTRSVFARLQAARRSSLFHQSGRQRTVNAF